MAAPAAAVPGFTSASLYVGDLIPDVTEALLFEIFNAVGPVASVRVCREAATRRSLGYAYVNFHRAEDAERALDTLNFKNIKGKPCRIMWCNRDPSLRKSGLGNIFVNGLAKSIDNKQLYDTFSLFGNILSCKVSTNKGAESLGYGFVHFESDESAAAAIDKVNGKVIAGEQVTVQTFKNKKERGGLNKNVFTNVFVKNLPAEMSKENVDELFSKHGQITSSVVNVDASNKGRAYAFINYNTPEEATAAVEGLNNFDLNGKKLFVGRAQKKEERERELREKFEQIKMDRLKKYQGVNLYIKNLADDVDDERLNQEFAKYGAITSARVMRDQTNNSRGFGFVCFSTPEEATKAVTEMNGKMISSKPLYVALAQRKEQRRAMLEQQHAARLGKMGPAPFPMYPPPQFAGMPPRGFAFPGQMPLRPGQFPPGRFPFPGQVPMRPGQPTFHLMPLNARGGAPIPNGLNRRNGQNNQNRRPQQGQQQGQQGQQQQQGIKYTDQARNRQQPAQQSAPAQQQAESQQGAVADEPLSLKALATAPVELQKQMIGERLFPLIVAEQPALAGKITGMLLEMDNGELLHLLESPQALGEKITEAVAVLQDHGLTENEGETDK